MSDTQIAVNPFGMMINPEAIIEAMNRSDRLERLQRHVYRPLDKPMLPRTGEDLEASRSDMEIDHEPESLIGTVAPANDLSDVIVLNRSMLAY